MIQYTIKHLPVFESATEVAVQCAAQEGDYFSQMQQVFEAEKIHTAHYWEMIIYMLRYITNQIQVFKTRK